MDIANSKNGVPVRLNYERWYHITENHDDLASYYHDVLDTVENPHFVMRGNKGTLKAIRSIGKGRWLTVIYKEVAKTDGFIITAYFLDKKPKGEIVWQQK